MKLDINKTYNNVKFRKWEIKCYNSEQVNNAITEIKSNNPNIIIVSTSTEDISECDDRFGGFVLTVLGMTTDNCETSKNNGYDFIEEFFDTETTSGFFALGDLLNSRVLQWWSEYHLDNVQEHLLDIHILNSRLNQETDIEKREIIISTVVSDAEDIILFDLDSEDVNNLSDEMINNLKEYNKILSSFKEEVISLKNRTK